MLCSIWRTLVLFCLGIAFLSAPGAIAAAPTEAESAPEPVPKERQNPRATLRTFYEAIDLANQTSRQRELDRAVSCLNFSNLSASIENTSGRDLAMKLREVLDRVLVLNLNRYSERPDAKPIILFEDSATNTKIELAPDERGDWRFTPETVAAINALYSAYSAKPKLTDNYRISLIASPSLWLRSHMPPFMLETVFLFEHWQWLTLLALIVGAWALGKLLSRLMQGPIQKFVRSREWPIPQERVWQVIEPLDLVFISLLWLFGIKFLGLPAQIQATVVLVVKCLAAFGFVRVAFRAINAMTLVLRQRASKTTSKFDDLAVPFVDKIAKFFVFAFGVVFVADVLDVSPTSLIAGLGIGGIALALAAQDTVKNLFGSFTIIFDRPFEIGDDVKIGDVTGTVEEVGFRSTRIRTYDNTLVTIPNGNLISANVDNIGQRSNFRLNTTLSLTYDTSPEKIHAFCVALRTLAEAHPMVRPNSVRAYLHQLAASSLDVLFIVQFKTSSSVENLNLRHNLLLDIIHLASSMNVDFAFPTQTLFLQSHAAETSSAVAEPTVAATTAPPADALHWVKQAETLGREKAAKLLASRADIDALKGSQTS